jgi:hypothetical protein
VYLAHNGDLFDFPILLSEIQAALNGPSLNKTISSCISSHCVQTKSNLSNMNPSIEMIDASTQTVIEYDEPSQTWLTTIACADSLIFFRNHSQLLKNTTRCLPTSAQSIDTPVQYIPSADPARQQPSMKLVNIYEREFPQSTTGRRCHRAEDDCLMLIAILKRYLADWLTWIERNHRPLSDFSSLSLLATR